MPTTSEVLAEGTRVRVKERSVSGDPDLDSGAGRVGDEYDVHVYASGSDGDDPNGRPYYLLDDEFTIGGSHWAYPEHVEVLMTPEQKAARVAPSLTEVRGEVASALIGMHRAIQADETEPDGDDAVIVYGKTDNGLRVAFRVHVSGPWEVDA